MRNIGSTSWPARDPGDAPSRGTEARLVAGVEPRSRGPRRAEREARRAARAPRPPCFKAAARPRCRSASPGLGLAAIEGPRRRPGVMMTTAARRGPPEGSCRRPVPRSRSTSEDATGGSGSRSDQCRAEQTNATSSRLHRPGRRKERGGERPIDHRRGGRAKPAAPREKQRWLRPPPTAAAALKRKSVRRAKARPRFKTPPPPAALAAYRISAGARGCGGGGTAPPAAAATGSSRTMTRGAGRGAGRCNLHQNGNRGAPCAPQRGRQGRAWPPT